MAAENRLDYLRKQFTKIDEETFCKIVACDVTPTKKYASWLLRLNSKSNLNLDNLNDAIQAVELFESLKDSLPKEHRDINTFQSISSLLFSVNSWLIKRFNENENTVSFLKKGAELLFENEDIFIVKLLSFEGSVNYGSNTKWCTLQPGTFVEYSSKGPLYIVYCKTDKYQKDFSQKSQLYFATGEYRNVENTAIDLIKIAVKNPQLYNCFSFIKDIKGINKDTDLFAFFNLNIMESSVVVDIANRFGIKILSFLKEINKDLLDDLFEHFGEKAYDEIPYSKEKLISFVHKVENGLKRIIKKGEYEISNEMIKESVKLFPENILLVDCEDEEIWKEVIEKESWLFKKSPFYKNAEKTFEVIMKVNEYVLNYVDAVKLFTESQRAEIAIAIVNNGCDNDLTLLASLGELKEVTQIKIVKKVPASIHYLVLPTEKTFEVQKDAKEKERLKEEKLKKETEERRKKSIYESPFSTWNSIGDYGDYDSNDYKHNYKQYGYDDVWTNSLTEQIIEQEDGSRLLIRRDKEGRVIKTTRIR